MDPQDFLQREKNRRLLRRSIILEAAREALWSVALTLYNLLCSWTSFAIHFIVWVAPCLIGAHVYFENHPEVKTLHLSDLIVPMLVAACISRCLFTLVVELLHYFAKRIWGLAYSRRMPKWVDLRQVRDITGKLTFSYTDIEILYEVSRGIVWLLYQPRGWLKSRKQPPKTACKVCNNLEKCWPSTGDSAIYYSHLRSSRERCVNCAILFAAVNRFYPPTDPEDPFFFQWKHYRPGDDIILAWRPHENAIAVELKGITAVWPRLTFYCLTKSLDLPLISAPVAAVNDTESEETMHKVKSWISTCTSEHAHCNKKQPRPLPDRVLDLGSSLDSPIRLIETQNQPEYYACLSHCWGKKQPLRTLAGDLEDFRTGIPIDILPKTFQDAVEVCRRLEIRYFWVDSLCIVQDSFEEWQQQSAKMATIYENAFLTIAATKAKGHDEGLHIEGKGNRVHIDRIPSSEIGHGVSEDVYVRLNYSAPGGIKHCDVQTGPVEQHDDEWPLLTRAWVFQERLLSPRMLHYAKKELVWECRTVVSCDCGQDHKQTEDLKFRRLVCNQSIKTTDVTPAQLRDLWYTIVGRYSLLIGNLTKEEDAFPALSGLASRISGLLGDEYVAGLWRSHLVEGLLWSCENKNADKTRCKLKAWRAPSWSWASMTDEISFQHNKTSLGRRSELYETSARVVDVTCNPTGSQKTGGLSSAALTLSGWVSYATVRVSRAEKRCFKSNKVIAYLDCELATQHDARISPFHADHPEDMVDGKSAVCLRLARIDTRDWYLVLVREGPNSNIYKRIGLYQGPDISWKWTSAESWRRRAEQRYRETKDVLRIV